MGVEKAAQESPKADGGPSPEQMQKRFENMSEEEKAKMRERFDNMSDEDKAKIRMRWEGRSQRQAEESQ